MAATDNTGPIQDPGHSLLGIYLNDHLAGATAGLDLFRRAAGHHGGTEIGDILGPLAAEVEEDRQDLLAMMAALGVAVRHYKVYAAWAAEKVGRLKLNGRLFARSPLSDLVELEAMRLGVEGKAAGWRTLRLAGVRYPELDTDQLDSLISRAQRQADVLEELRQLAAGRAVGIVPTSEAPS